MTQYTSWAFTQRARTSGLVPSMGLIGDCFDNAVIESFWGQMQTELLNRQRWRTHIELANAIFEYLEVFHNRQRRHSALAMLTPIKYEEMLILNHNAFPQVLIARPNGTLVNVIIGVQPGGTNKPAEFTLDQLVAVMQQLDGPGIDL